MKEFIEDAHKNGVMFFVLVSLISSDTLVDVKSCEEALEHSKEMLRGLEEAEIPDEDKKKYKKYLERGLGIIKRDLKEYKERDEAI